MKKHKCRKVKTVRVNGYVAVRKNKVIIVPSYKRCPPNKH